MKKKPVFGVRSVSAPLALAVAMIAATPAFAADDVSPALEAAMQRDLGLGPAQLSQYLEIERLSQRSKGLEKQQGAHFAGSWIERQGAGNFKFVVATTSAGAQKSGAEIDIRSARHSLSDLDAAKGQLDLRLAQGARVPKGVYGWYVDVKSNSVVVAIGKGGQQAGIDFVARSGADARTVRFVVEAEQPTLRGTLKGGLGYLRDPGDGYLYACSIGFNVAKGTTLGYVSAGHCGDAGEPAYFEGSSGTGPQWTLGAKIGTFQASSFPNPGQTGNDWSWVAMSTGHSQSPTVYGWGKGDATVKGSTAVGVGGAICRSGRTTGWQCGTVEATGQTVSYSSGETILNLTRTTACSEGGDSGGSFITGPGQAQGVLSGGSGTCRGKHRSSRSYFQPLLPILSAYGLTLKTG